MKIVKPFVKWAGGKNSLIPQITKYYPFELKNGFIERYIEPFVGGGAVLIDILQKYEIKEAYAFDINIDLINCYNVIKHNVEELINELDKKEREKEALQRKIELQNQEEWVYVEGIKGMTEDMKGYDNFQFEVG